MTVTGSTWFILENERLILENARLKKLCAQAADVLQDEFGSPENPDYGTKGPVHKLIAELREAAAEAE